MKKLIGLLVVILCCAGAYKIVQMPEPLTGDLRGFYQFYSPTEGVHSHIQMSVGDRDFHVFEGFDYYRYGEYEKVGENQYRLWGRHIDEQIVTLNENEKTLTIQLNGEVSFKKVSNTPTVINDSEDRAKDNDRRTEAQLEPLVNIDTYDGTFARLNEEGKVAQEERYRFAVDGTKFWLYQEQTGFLAEGECKEEDFKQSIFCAEPYVKEQETYLINGNFVLSVDGKDMVFAKITNDVILP